MKFQQTRAAPSGRLEMGAEKGWCASALNVSAQAGIVIKKSNRL
jgi:hypothetical protein